MGFKDVKARLPFTLENMFKLDCVVIDAANLMFLSMLKLCRSAALVLSARAERGGEVQPAWRRPAVARTGQLAARAPAGSPAPASPSSATASAWSTSAVAPAAAPAQRLLSAARILRT